MKSRPTAGNLIMPSRRTNNDGHLKPYDLRRQTRVIAVNRQFYSAIPPSCPRVQDRNARLSPIPMQIGSVCVYVFGKVTGLRRFRCTVTQEQTVALDVAKKSGTRTLIDNKRRGIQ
ncbi:hypothetical protein GWI33_001995 [Rhynchophorus ferrugineus]|uniref:Uncharacterized protein n=1 Tax=Rhynchophorus ferrugineus TaxID=354439 RepID=A0A834INA3_RHYFE|nr:hypothetical protein GWI33_001995 [Rhynchophorus ferrugineus]